MPRDPQPQYASEPLYGPAGGPMSQAIPLHGPVSHPDGPREYTYSHVQHLSQFSPHPPTEQSPGSSGSRPADDERNIPDQSFAYTEPYNRGPDSSQPPSPGHEPGSNPGGAGANHYPSSSGVPRLPPILQVEKQQVTTSATQLASASRRRNEAHFVCPVPGCGSTFTRRFNLRGHLRSHTEERPYVCEWPGCKKGFARQHDCKRHQALHTAKSQNNVCRGCKKAFSRLDALNRHLRSDGGAECRASNPKFAAEDKRL
ncbi:Transcriptional regulator CRZ1 [Termitomyces sp. J132]|nr:Transcriptional regulator CRZ1 [Termitomyces sp. J132]